MPTNDNDFPQAAMAFPTSCPHGRAALLLVESLIHGLCEQAALTASQAVEIAERALAVQFDQAEAADGAGVLMWQSHELLMAITDSLRMDDQGGPQPRLIS